MCTRAKCSLCESSDLTPPSSGRQKGCAFLPPLMSNVRRRQYHHPMQQGRTSIAASVPRVACLAAPVRRAACPLAVGARIVLRTEACAGAVLGRPSVGGRRIAAQVPSKCAAPRKLTRRQRTRGHVQAWLPNQRAAPVLLGSAGARAPALRVRSACAAFVLRYGRHRPAAHAGVGVGGVRVSPTERSAVLSHQQRASLMQRAPPNHSIERTPYGMLRMPPVAAHVER
jgi:hypothetical protein